MDLLKLLYVFVKIVLCLLPFAKQKPSWSLTKISKLVRDSALNVGVEWVKVLNALSPSCLWHCFCIFASLYLFIFVFCICADTALRMLLSFCQPKCQPPWPPGRLPKHSSAKRCHDDEEDYKNDDDDNDEDFKNDDENRKTCFWLLLVRSKSILLLFCRIISWFRSKRKIWMN